jgi:hypothetical protein
LRIHDRISLTDVLETEQVANLVQRGTALHVCREDSPTVIVQRQGDARGVDLPADILAPGFADAAAGHRCHPFHDYVCVGR